MKIKNHSFLLLFLFLLLPLRVYAAGASLYLSPVSTSRVAGENVTVNVYISSEAQAINAIQGTISFPTDKLSIISLDRGVSSVNFWVKEPSFSNERGTVEFEGIVLNPGFVGGAGKILSINFQTKNAGDALVHFSAGTVLANDGKGTSMPVSFGASAITVIAKGTGTAAPAPSNSSAVPSASAPAKPAAKLEVPAAPVVSSVTHPDPAVSYRSRDVRLSWALPSDVTGVSFLLTDKPESNPGTVSDGLVSATSFDGVEAGTKYFHLRLRNAGGWGAITHFRINIDTEEPSILSLEIVKDADVFEKGVRVEIITDADAPDIARLGAIVDSSDEVPLVQDHYGDYLLPPVAAGEHVVIVKAYDEAGNFDVASENFTLAPFAAPEIEYALAKIGSGSYLVVRGNTYANASVTIWLKQTGGDPVSYEVESDQSGDFMFMSREELDADSYAFWVEASNPTGLKTDKTAEKTFRVPGAQGRTLYALLEILAAIVGFFLLTLFVILRLFPKLSSKGKKVARRKKVAGIDHRRRTL